MFDFYRDSPKNVIDIDINDRVPDKNNLLQLSKPSVLAFWQKRAVFLLS